MQHIVLSPHFDDAALSCGGMIAELGAAGETVIVAAIFGGRPDQATLSPFARSIHQRPGAASDLHEQRIAEELAAVAILGAQSRPGYYLDCIYRQDEPGGRWLYASEKALFGAVDPADERLVEELAAVVASLAPASDRCLIYSPLGIGNHVDHQVVQRSAMLLRKAEYQVMFYEDYPYVVRDLDGPESTLSRIAPRTQWLARPVPLSRAGLSIKIQAIDAYASQIGVLFGSESAATRRNITAAVDGFARHTARSVGAARFAERLWMLQQGRE